MRLSLDIHSALALAASRPESAGQMLLFRAFQEARRFAWIESERAKCDLGLAAIQQWFQRYWPRWTRAQWVAHLKGAAYCYEFGLTEFGLFQRMPHDTDLVNAIIQQLANDADNLSIASWAARSGRDLKQTMAILKALQINERRPAIKPRELEVLARAFKEADKHKYLLSQRVGRDVGEDGIWDWFCHHWPALAQALLVSDRPCVNGY